MGAGAHEPNAHKDAATAELTIRQGADGSFSLWSPRFGEGFHSRRGALREARETFLAPSQLERFSPGQRLTVVEVCVGTGTNLALLLEGCVELGLELEWWGLELDPAPMQLALADPAFRSQWHPQTLQTLETLSERGCWQQGAGSGRMLWGDARQTLPQLLEFIRKNPGKLNYGSAGNGTSHHLAGELFKLQTKTFITHIPYRGAGPMLQDLIAGQVDLCFDGLGSSAAHIKGGRIRAIAVAGERRAPGFPDVPTAAESGVPTYKVATWYAIWAPKGTPAEAINGMQAEMRKALASDEIRAAWTGLGTELPNTWGPDMGRFVSAEVKRWAEVVKNSGAKLD
jgi:hypothetical protein